MNAHSRNTVVLITADDAFADRVTNTLFPHHQVVRGKPSDEEVQKLLASCGPDVCLVDVDRGTWEQQPDMSLIVSIRAALDQVPIIFVTYDLSTTTLVPAMRAGANDVCDKDFASEELLAQIDRYVNRRAAKLGQEMATLYTFLGAREGGGTTTTALAFAEMLAAGTGETRRRAGDNPRVLVLDFSHPPAQIPDLVGARPTYFVTDAIHDLSRLDETMLDDAFLRAWYPNLYVLPLATSERGIASISLDDLIKLVTILKTYFHAVVADTNWCWRVELATRLFLSADHPLLCISQSITSVHAASAFLDHIRETGSNNTIYRTILTRYDPALKPSAPDVQKALGAALPPLTIPEDRHHVELTRNAGQPLTRNGRSAFSKAVAALVDEMTETPADVTRLSRRLDQNLRDKFSSMFARRINAAK